jgi:hypothetical protein
VPVAGFPDGGVRVAARPLEGDFAAQRNALQDLARHAWMLQLDADESIEPATGRLLPALAALAHEAGALFHSDAAQGAGKVPTNVRDDGIDLLSLSGHKLYGPKGVGALYVRRRPRVRLAPLFSGGGQERGLRSGTLPTPLIVGLGEACRLAGAEMAEEAERLAGLRDRLLAGLPVTARDIVGMGVGGLLVDTAARPRQRRGADAGVSRPAAIVLAAGRSSRMGSNKLVAPVGGVPMVRRVVETLERRPYDRIHGGWWPTTVAEGARDVVRASARRYVEWPGV